MFTKKITIVDETILSPEMWKLAIPLLDEA